MRTGAVGPVTGYGLRVTNKNSLQVIDKIWL